MLTDLTAARELTVRRHMALENEQDWEGVLATFEVPRYEFAVPRMGPSAMKDTFVGRDEVMEYFETSRSAFPDQRNELLHLGQGPDCVFVEFWLMGTHLGPLRSPRGDIAPTGRTFRARMAAVFEFAPGSDKIVSERPYGDPRDIQRQLGLS